MDANSLIHNNMTRDEIEQIIRENIRTNGRGEITARVMAGVLESFVNYTDSQAETFAALCEQLAVSFSALVTEMEGKFETKAEALEASFEAFTTALLEEHFEPWAENLASTLTELMRATKDAAETAAEKAAEAKAASLQAKAAADAASADSALAKGAAEDAAVKSAQAKDAIDVAADGISEALEIIREGNQNSKIVVPNGLKFGNSALSEYPSDRFDFSNVIDFADMFSGNKNLETAPALLVVGPCPNIFTSCMALLDISEIVIEASGHDADFRGAFEYGFSGCNSLVEIPAGVVSVRTDFYAALNYAFSSCANLERVTVTLIKGEISTIYLTATFAWCPKLEDFTFIFAGENNDITFIAQETFQGCDALQAISRSFLERCISITNITPVNMTGLPGFDASLLDTWNEQRTWEDLQMADIGVITNLNPSSFNIQGYKRLTLASLQNIVNGLVENQYSMVMMVSAESFATMQADTTQYTYGGNTYVGLLNLASAKNWTVTAN